MLIAALLIFRRPLFFGDALYFRDLQIFFAPMKHFLATALAGGTLPLWNPSLQMGSPFLADPQAGVLYPPSLLFLFFDVARGMAFSLMVHLTLAQAGLFALARHQGFDRSAALAGALAYGLGGWMLSSVNMLTLAHSAAWAPWTVLVFERMWRQPTAERLLATAVVLAMQMFSGWPEMFLMLALILLVRRLAQPGLWDWRWLAASLAAGLIAAGLFAPQGLASWEAFHQSVRVGGMREDQLFEFSATAGQWRSLLLPPTLGSDDWDILATFVDGHVPIFLSLYLGWVALALVLISLLGPLRHLAVWLGLVGCGVFLALGNANPVAMVLLRQVNIFRSPEKWLFLVHLGVCMLLVAGCARLLSALPRRTARALGAMVVLALGGELLYVNDSINLMAPPGYYDLTQSAQNADLQIIQAQPGRVYATSVTSGQTESVRDLYGGFRRMLTPNLGMLSGTNGHAIGYVDGVSFIQSKQNAAVLDLLDTPPGELLARRLGFLGVRWMVSDDPAFASSAQWVQMTTAHTPTLWQLREFAPWLTFARHVEAASDDTLLGHSLNPELTRGELALVAAGNPLVGGDFSGEVMAGVIEAGHVQARVVTPTGGLVVLRESFYPGWTAHIDDQPAPLVRTNRFFMGLAVPPGEHRLRFDYRPTHWTLGWLLASMAMLALLALTVVAIRRYMQQPTS